EIMSSCPWPAAPPLDRRSPLGRLPSARYGALWVTHEDDVAFDQIMHLRWPRFLRPQIGDVKACNHLKACRRRRDQQGCRVNRDFGGVGPGTGNGARGQEALNDRGGDHLDETGKLRIAHGELALVAAPLQIGYAREPKPPRP